MNLSHSTFDDDLGASAEKKRYGICDQNRDGRCDRGDRWGLRMSLMVTRRDAHNKAGRIIMIGSAPGWRDARLALRSNYNRSDARLEGSGSKRNLAKLHTAADAAAHLCPSGLHVPAAERREPIATGVTPRGWTSQG